MSLASTRTGTVRAATPLEPTAPNRTGQFPHIARAAETAVRFWERVAADDRIESTDLRHLAVLNRGPSHASRGCLVCRRGLRRFGRAPDLAQWPESRRASPPAITMAR